MGDTLSSPPPPGPGPARHPMLSYPSSFVRGMVASLALTGTVGVGMLGLARLELSVVSSSSSSSSSSTGAEDVVGAAKAEGCSCRRRANGTYPSPLRLEHQRSPLELLYEQTNDGADLSDWARHHVQRAYPNFPDDHGLVLGTPSLAHDPRTNRTVVGVRVQSHSMRLALEGISYLMLCELRPTNGTAGAEWRCHDSGIENYYVPPECDRMYWKAPEKRVFFGITLVGLEDARLLLDEQGRLGGTFVMRGCHPDTPYGNRTALFSVYSMRWRDTHETWRVDGYPKLLDLRKFNMDSLGGDYPPITKSWITIPGRGGRIASHDRPDQLRFSVGWTQGVENHVVYKVSDPSSTRYAVTPLRDGVDYSRLDLKNYRASTNYVEFYGALLAMGHHRSDKYYHYWYAICPDEPHRAVAWGDLMVLPHDPSVTISFALGLAMEGRNLYLSWSESDSASFLTRCTAEDVLDQLRNSSFARTRGDAYDGFVNFTALCQNLGGA